VRSDSAKFFGYFLPKKVTTRKPVLNTALCLRHGMGRDAPGLCVGLKPRGDEKMQMGFSFHALKGVAISSGFFTSLTMTMKHPEPQTCNLAVTAYEDDLAP
jgi:hypothetical protein